MKTITMSLDEYNEELRNARESAVANFIDGHHQIYTLLDAVCSYLGKAKYPPGSSGAYKLKDAQMLREVLLTRPASNWRIE